jgi:hypothetical protein
MNRTNDRELNKLKSFCRNSSISRIAIVSTHWNHDGSRVAQENERFKEAQVVHWDSFIKEGAHVKKLNPKPNDSPFKRNPIDAEEVWNILLSVVDEHASTNHVKFERQKTGVKALEQEKKSLGKSKTPEAKKRSEEIKQEIRRLKLNEARRSGNFIKIIFYSL